VHIILEEVKSRIRDV